MAQIDTVADTILEKLRLVARDNNLVSKIADLVPDVVSAVKGMTSSGSASDSNS